MSDFDHRQLDDLIHSRVRLAIMAYLASVDVASFKEIKAKTGVSDGNLSANLTKLEKAGFIAIKKSFQGRKPLTEAKITQSGRAAFKGYVDDLAAIVGLRNSE